MNARLLPLLAALVALSTPISAGHCATYGTTEPDVDTMMDLPVSPTGGSGRYYVDNGQCHMCIFDIWVYEESNGIDGLQRGDEMWDDTCHGSIRSDTVIF